KNPVPHGANCPDGDPVGVRKLEFVRHRDISRVGTRPAGPLVTPMASTPGPPGPYTTVEIEQGATTIRWKRSRGTPRTLASTTFMQSACETATTTSPACALQIRATVSVSRDWSSTKDSPPGKRNPEGQRCTVCHSGSLRSSASDLPVQVPK